MLYPTLNSPMFWDMVSLGGYLVLNALIGYISLSSEKKGIAPPKWIKPFIIISIPWAFSIHTVTAFLYSGLTARPFWMTAVLAPRFLASAFAAGPALLIIICYLLKSFTRFDVGREAIKKLSIITTYAMSINVFLILMELFTVFYSSIPEHIHHFEFLFIGLDGNTRLVPWMWSSAVLAVVSLVILLTPKFRTNKTALIIGSMAVFISIWIDKGMGMIIAGFTPNQFGTVTDYWPTGTELLISAGVYGIGLLILTLLYKIVLMVRGETKSEPGRKLPVAVES
jgi:molybdopterin-containing oxidoreductase family membrane subunit